MAWPDPPNPTAIVAPVIIGVTMSLITLLDAQLAFGHVALLDHAGFSLETAERVGLIGRNGAGKSSLLKILGGLAKPDDGTLHVQQGVRIAYVAQEPSLDPQVTVFKAVSEGLQHVIAVRDQYLSGADGLDLDALQSVIEAYDAWNWEQRVEETLQRLHLDPDAIVETLSGGTKKRVALAQALVTRPDVLLLDEPTNHLDLESREALVSALQKFTGTLLMVAHDRWLLSQVGAEAWELDKKGITVFPDFVSYDAERRARNAAAGAGGNGQGAQAQDAGSAGDAGQGLSREEQKRLKREQAERRNALHKELKPLQGKYDALEKELAKVLDEQGTVEGQLADPEIYADHARSSELLKTFEACKKRGEDLFEEMTALEERMDAVRGRWNTDD